MSKTMKTKRFSKAKLLLSTCNTDYVSYEEAWNEWYCL